MKVLQINSVYRSGSTGVIMKDIAEALSENGDECYCAFATGCAMSDFEYTIETRLQQMISIAQSRLFGKHGFYNKSETRKLVAKIRKISPDIIHLHNIHGHYINMKILFSFLKEYGKPVIWTLHDCWPFTGHCSHFESVGCEKWKSCCFDCPQLNTYPISWIFDRSKSSWNDKKELINSLDRLTFCPVSNWLGEIAKQSFAKYKNIEVIYNGVDTELFCPQEKSVTEKEKLRGKFVILGMANKWLLPENAEVVDWLMHNLPETAVVLLVGCPEHFKNPYPGCIIPVPFIRDPKLLARYYSAADVFVNLTLEDTFPTVNMESLSCGTPLITYQSGGSGEVVNQFVGYVIPKKDKEALLDRIMRIYNGALGENVRANCRKQILENFDKKESYKKYIALYQKLSAK